MKEDLPTIIAAGFVKFISQFAKDHLLQKNLTTAVTYRKNHVHVLITYPFIILLMAFESQAEKIFNGSKIIATQ